jgi:hypothetical protein
LRREGGLAHRGTGREDEEVAGLEAARHLVELLVARGQARQLAAAVHQHVDVVDGVVHLDGDGREARARLRGREREDPRLGLVEQRVGGLPRLVAEGHDLRRRRDQAPLDRAVPDDLRVVHDVRRRRHVVGDLGEGDRPPDAVEQALALQIGGERREVDGLVVVLQADHRAEQHLVRRVVEILFADLRHDRMDRLVVEQDGGEDGLLGLDVVGRDPSRHHFGLPHTPTPLDGRAPERHRMRSNQRLGFYTASARAERAIRAPIGSPGARARPACESVGPDENAHSRPPGWTVGVGRSIPARGSRPEARTGSAGPAISSPRRP